MASMMNVIYLLTISLFVSQTFGATLYRQSRAVAELAPNQKQNRCENTTPCGWAVYHRFTRDIDYFMKNKCECPDGKKCLRADDDISVTAYVYRCKAGKESNNES